jgi:hypothetical protein
LSHYSNHFCDGYFLGSVSLTICPGWLWTMILLIPASCVARIAGVSHRHPAHSQILLGKIAKLK